MRVHHLGSQASALLDGRLTPAEEERAWAHVHLCHGCRDLVEREGWVKTRLAGIAMAGAAGPTGLKQRLQTRPDDLLPRWADLDPAQRRTSLALLAGGAIGTAMLGVLALGVGPASAPTWERRLPAGSIGGTVAPTQGAVDSTPDRTRPSRVRSVPVKMSR